MDNQKSPQTTSRATRLHHAISVRDAVCGLFMLLLLVSCSTGKLLPGETELKRVNILSTDENVDAAALRPYVIQRPGMQGGKKRKVAYDSTKTALSCRDLTQALNNEGFLHADVTAEATPYKGKKTKTEVTYTLHPRERYTVSSIKRDIRDRAIDSLLTASYKSELAAGKPFSVAALNRERDAITHLLQDRGYYKFNKDFVKFYADTIAGSTNVDVTLLLTLYRANSRSPETEHPVYTLGKIAYHNAGQRLTTETDTLSDERPLPLRPSVLDENTSIESGRLYSASALQRTYQRFARLNALRYTNVSMTERGDTLDCDIAIAPNKPNTISIQPEGTNTSGDFGAAVSLTYENRNLFRGSETLSLSLRGSYEAITGLEGYNNQDYIEYGVEARLQFPRFLAPFVSRFFKRMILSTSELSVAYNSQDRPEFHRRMFSAAWRYKWAEPRHHTNYTFDLLDLNYVFMPWISETFKKDYLDSETSNNVILRYNYEDLFIMKMGFGLNYNNGINALKLNFETSGNLLQLISRSGTFSKNAEGQYTLFNIAFAQYVKFDIDATHRITLTPHSELFLHGGLGVAYPYGNSSVLPFEKRYFSGGANSVRGWSVRELGPGSYKGTDGRIDFINQTGDIRLDLNLEYRAFLFWKLYGAAFVDAGNIWTIRNYESQPGGQFRFKNILRDMAVAYGLGVRLNFSYFFLRLDAGMKAVNPAYTTSREHYPVIHPRLSRDLTFHFAVGLPF